MLSPISDENSSEKSAFNWRNLHTLPTPNKFSSIFTVLGSQSCKTHEFIFHADRIIKLLAEYAINFASFKPKLVTTPTGHSYEGIELNCSLCVISVLNSGKVMEDALRKCFENIPIGHVLIDDENEIVSFCKVPHNISNMICYLALGILDNYIFARLAIELLLEKNVSMNQIIILSITITESVIREIKKNFSAVQILTGCIECDNNRSTANNLTSFHSKYYRFKN